VSGHGVCTARRGGTGNNYEETLSGWIYLKLTSKKKRIFRPLGAEELLRVGIKRNLAAELRERLERT